MSRQMTSRIAVAIALTALLALGGCSKPAGQGSATSGAAEKVRQAPDLGGVEKQYVEVEGVGATRAAAVDDALRLAIKQVNGLAIDASEANLNIATSVATSNGDVDITAASFASAVATQSHGVISDFKILQEKKEGGSFLGIGGKTPDGTTWRVRIGASIAKYKPSADANRPRIIVVEPRTSATSFEFGSEARSADTVKASIRSRLTNALTQTNRFAVLDREFNDEIQNEMDLVGSGAVNKEDTARLGQMLAADLLVIPTIERMEYVRHARALRLADRELVSYSGGARISFRVVNATTGQMILSDTFMTEFPTTQPTTLGASVDADGAAEKALAGMTQQFISKLLQKTFPVSVISLSGSQVVLSQGGAAVRQGTRYRAVLLGDALTDPQTGQSLGRAERDFGTILVARSDPNAAYGVLEGAPSLAPSQFRPGLIELREEVGAPSAQPPSSAESAVAKPPPAAKARQRTAAASSPQSAPAKDKDW
jgi:curli biogenesis system outer membrane secretion channel CsgG